MAKFALPMKNGVAVSKMAELREHFDLKEAIRYLGNGRLMKWLRDRGYDEEADKLDTLIDECKGNHLELAKRLCAILDVEFDETKFNADELERLNELSQKAEKLGQYTSDNAILTLADRCAFNQEDLDKLAKDDEEKIYLCNGQFTIPLDVKNKRYIGIGKKVVVIINSKEPVDFEKVGIRFENVQFDENYAKLKRDATRQSILSFFSNEENGNKYNVLSELIYKVHQVLPFRPIDIKWGEIFGASSKNVYFSYNTGIEKKYFIDELVEQKAVEYADIICYLSDLHFTYAGGIVFTQHGVIDYQMESQKWFYFPYQDIRAVHYGKKFLSIQVPKFEGGTKYDFEQDFGERGWNAHHIGVFLETVIGIKPAKSKDQEAIKGIKIESLNGENIFDYLK